MKWLVASSSFGVFHHHVGRGLVSIVLLSLASAASYGLAAALQHQAAALPGLRQSGAQKGHQLGDVLVPFGKPAAEHADIFESIGDGSAVLVVEQFVQSVERTFGLFDELGRPDADYAVTLLNSACRAPEAVTRTALSYALARSIGDTGMREDRLRYLLDILLNDGYLVEENRRWRFRPRAITDTASPAGK